jgi:hypothetical protein
MKCLQLRRLRAPVPQPATSTVPLGGLWAANSETVSSNHGLNRGTSVAR